MDTMDTQQFSPQAVGNEFVRQYYTLLNKAPNQLRRFYNNNSSYTHGDSQVVVGKREIHNRIQQLDFKDCQANIFRVDAQVSPGDGVVLQVSGELSNDGQPMRRFFQTFVLVAQSSRKYYVHNDILTYHDRGSAQEKNQIKETLACSIVPLDQDLAIRAEQVQNKEQVKEQNVKMVDQAVQVVCDLGRQDNQVQNKEQLDKPEVQMVDQAVQVACDMVSTDQDLGRKDKQDRIEKQVEKLNVQKVDKALQVACTMVSKYTQPEPVASGTACSAASQTEEIFLETQANLPPPQSNPNKITLRRKSPVVQQRPNGLKKSSQLIEQKRQEQPSHTVTQEEETTQKLQLNNKPKSTSSSSSAAPDKVLPQKQLLFTESLGGQVGAGQTNTNGNKRNGNSLIHLEIEISIYLVDNP